MVDPYFSCIRPTGYLILPRVKADGSQGKLALHVVDDYGNAVEVDATKQAFHFLRQHHE